MKLIGKLLMGFMAVALVVLIAGLIGIFSAARIGSAANQILEKDVPAKDVSMEAIISVIAARDAAAEYLLQNEGLQEIEGEINEFIGDFNMWLAMIEYGTESDAFRNSAAGRMYENDGIDLVVQKGSGQMLSILETARAEYNTFAQNLSDLVNYRKAEISSYKVLDADMESFDASYGEIDTVLAQYLEGLSADEQTKGTLAAYVIVSKMKGIGEEYAGITDADTETLAELRSEYDALAREYAGVAQYLSNELQAQIEGFIESGTGILAQKEIALGNSGSTRQNMEMLDLSSSNAEEALGELEELVDSMMTASIAASDNIQQSAQLLLIITVVVGFIAALTIGISLSLRISRPLSNVADLAQKLADGDFSVEQQRIKRKDEVGAMSRAFAEMITALKYKASVIGQISDGDLTADVELASENDSLGQTLAEMSESLNDLLSQVAIAVQQVTSGSTQVSQAGQALSQGAAEQASSLEEITSSLTEVNGQSRQNAENATEASVLAKKAVEDAEGGNEKMKDLLSAIERINASSDEISKVVKVIDDIAFQINLLALNANVEAARAGKYGKGFAVVADEVRNLAIRSAEAVKETTGMVEETTAAIADGTAAAETTAQQLVDIVTGSTKVAEYLGDIALASKEQAQGIDQTNSGLEQIDQVTQANTASAEESASAAEELAAQAQQLAGMISRFQLKNSVSFVGSANTPKSAELMHSPSGNGNGNGNGSNGHNGDAHSESEKLVSVVDPKQVIQLDDEDFSGF